MPGHPPIDLVVDHSLEDGVAVLVVRGELDIAGAAMFDAAFDSAPDVPVVIDLCSCTFMDSSGLSVLLRRVARGKVAVACAPAGPARLLFELTGVTDQRALASSGLRVFDTREEAVAAVQDEVAA